MSPPREPAPRPARRGPGRLPLAGIPFAVKDNYATRDIPTTANARLLADHVTGFDSAAVARLRAAGGVLTGKLNTWEYGTGARGPVPRFRDAACAQSVGARSLSRRILDRLGRRGRRGPRGLRARLGHRRLDPGSRVGLRPARPEAHLRPDQPLRRSSQQLVPRRDRAARTLGAGLRARAAGARRRRLTRPGDGVRRRAGLRRVPRGGRPRPAHRRRARDPRRHPRPRGRGGPRGGSSPCSPRRARPSSRATLPEPLARYRETTVLISGSRARLHARSRLPGRSGPDRPGGARGADHRHDDPRGRLPRRAAPARPLWRTGSTGSSHSAMRWSSRRRSGQPRATTIPTACGPTWRARPRPCSASPVTPRTRCRRGSTKAGLPTSAQIVGPYFAEARVLRVAHAYEQAVARPYRRPTIAAGSDPASYPPIALEVEPVAPEEAALAAGLRPAARPTARRRRCRRLRPRKCGAAPPRERPFPRPRHPLSRAPSLDLPLRRGPINRRARDPSAPSVRPRRSSGACARAGPRVQAAAATDGISRKRSRSSGERHLLDREATPARRRSRPSIQPIAQARCAELAQAGPSRDRRSHDLQRPSVGRERQLSSRIGVMPTPAI